MTLSEFNERTNAHLTEDQYKPVENMYNEAGNIQKDQFCADWKKHNDSVLLQEFFAQSERLKGKVDGYRNQINEIAFDPFMGVGSTGVAALALERRFIGVEIDENYFNAAKTRIDNAQYT